GRPAGLAGGEVLVVDVADLPDRRPTGERHAGHRPGGEAQDGEGPVLGHELDARAGRPRHLRALTRLQLDRVDEGAGRDVLEGKRVADTDVGSRTGLDGRADPELSG